MKYLILLTTACLCVGVFANDIEVEYSKILNEKSAVVEFKDSNDDHYIQWLSDSDNKKVKITKFLKRMKFSPDGQSIIVVDDEKDLTDNILSTWIYNKSGEKRLLGERLFDAFAYSNDRQITLKKNGNKLEYTKLNTGEIVEQGTLDDGFVIGSAIEQFTDNGKYLFTKVAPSDVSSGVKTVYWSKVQSIAKRMKFETEGYDITSTDMSNNGIMYLTIDGAIYRLNKGVVEWTKRPTDENWVFDTVSTSKDGSYVVASNYNFNMFEVFNAAGESVLQWTPTNNSYKSTRHLDRKVGWNSDPYRKAVNGLLSFEIIGKNQLVIEPMRMNKRGPWLIVNLEKPNRKAKILRKNPHDIAGRLVFKRRLEKSNGEMRLVVADILEEVQ